MIDFDQLKQILVIGMRIDDDLITPEATLPDIELDSLGAVELSMHLQQRGVEVSDEQLLASETVAGILRLILDQTRGAA